MSEDRELLQRLVVSLKAAPPPSGWRARLRRRGRIRRAEGMVEWEEARGEGPAYFFPQRNAMGQMWSWIWVGSAAAALIRTHHPLALGRVGLILGVTALPLAVGFLYLWRFPQRMWRATERRFAAHLEQARALPAAPGRPEP